jgi:hypothetical protein
MTGGRAQSPTAPRALSANPSVNMRGRMVLGPSDDNPSRKITFTPFVPGTPSGFEFSEATTRTVQAMMPGLRWLWEGSPLRCSTRR